MTSIAFDSLIEDPTASPLHEEFRRLLKAQIDRGEAPMEVIEAALATATALCIDAEGLLKTSARLTHVGNLLATASPEVQAKMATEQQKAGATAH